MTRKKERGRPMEKKYPPRIDATAEELAQAMFRAGPVVEKVYTCADCKREVYYPEILYRDNRCEECHQKADDPKRVPRCFCGIEIDRANSLCTEPDCFYRR